MSKRYTTRKEAIDQEIIPALDTSQACGPLDVDDVFDVDAIADEVLAYRVDTNADGNELLNTAGFEQVVDVTEFWQIVAKHVIN